MFELLGSSQKEIWSQLAAELGGEIESSFWTGMEVTARSGPWIVHLNMTMVGKVPFTRLQAPFDCMSDFRFRIYRKSIFSDLGKKLGMQDIEIGDPEFDENFIIKSNDEPQVRSYFADANLREHIRHQEDFDLMIVAGSDFAYSLELRTPGVVKDIQQLKGYFELFAVALEQLCRIGTARHPQ